MKLTHLLGVALMLTLGFATSALATDYQFVSAQKARELIVGNVPLAIVDVQREVSFKKRHIQGAEGTYAYPVVSETDRQKLDGVIKKVKHGKQTVVVVCPVGAGPAKRAVDCMVKAGIDPARLYILEHGQGGWPYKDLLAN